MSPPHAQSAEREGAPVPVVGCKELCEFRNNRPMLEWMQTLVVIVETGSLSAAARRLRCSVASVSRQLAALEEELGVALVVRSTRRLRLTDAGERYYERCLDILRRVGEARLEARRRRALEGVVRVSAPVSFAIAVLAPAVYRIVPEQPRVRVELRLEDRVADLVAEGIDVAVRAGLEPPPTGAFVATELSTYRRLLVAAPSYLRRRGAPASPEELGAHDVLVHSPAVGTPGSWTLAGANQRTSVQIQVEGRLTSNNFLALRDAALAGLGVALLPEWLVDAELAAGRLDLVLRDWRSPPVRVVALYRTSQRGDPRLKWLVSSLRAQLAANA
jgi:DNA-binding transcriptional LysR family regulator